MNVWYLRDAQWRIAHRTMTRSVWRQYQHDARLYRRNVRLAVERIGVIARQVTEQVVEVARVIAATTATMASEIERLVATFANDQTFQRWRLVNTLAEIAEMKRHE